MAYLEAIERFVQKFEISDDGCWRWTARVDRLGYGRFWDHGQHYPHRWLWQYLFGPVPKGLELDHLCRVPGCINPDHLEAVTHMENVRRGISRCMKITHCPKGHPYDEENTYLVQKKNGRTARNCRACSRIAQREYRTRLARA